MNYWYLWINNSIFFGNKKCQKLTKIKLKKIYIGIIYNINIYKMDANLNNAQAPNNEYIYCRASDITKLLKTPIDRRNIAKELSKYNI